MQIKIEHNVYIVMAQQANSSASVTTQQANSSEPMMMWNNAFDEDNTSEDIEEADTVDCAICKLKCERASCKAFSCPEADPEPIVGYDTLRVCTLRDAVTALSTDEMTDGCVVPYCGHIMHANCLRNMMIQSKNKCPTCKAVIALKPDTKELRVIAHLFEGLTSHGSNRVKFEFFQTWMKQNSYRYFRSSVVRAFEALNAFNLDDKYYFAYSGLATFAVGYVVYAALVDPTGILSFDQQIVNFGEKILQSTEIRRARIHEDDIVTAFLTRGNKIRATMIKSLLAEIYQIRGNTMLTFMGTDLGDAEKVSDLLEQWGDESPRYFVDDCWGGHGSTWDDATVTALMFEGLIKGTRESEILDHFDHWARSLNRSNNQKPFDAYKRLYVYGNPGGVPATTYQQFVLVLPGLYLLSIVYVIYAAFLNSGGVLDMMKNRTQRETAWILTRLGRKVSKMLTSDHPWRPTATATSIIEDLMSDQMTMARTGLGACDFVINELVKQHTDNQTLLTYKNQTIGTVGKAIAVLHQLGEQCRRFNDRHFVPNLYNIARAALMPQSGGGIETIGSELPTRITSIEEETVFDPTGNYALSPSVPASSPYTVLGEEGDSGSETDEGTDGPEESDPEISVAVAGVPASSPYTVLGEEGDSGSETDEGTDGPEESDPEISVAVAGGARHHTMIPEDDNDNMYGTYQMGGRDVNSILGAVALCCTTILVATLPR
jgi:hypothetical protein